MTGNTPTNTPYESRFFERLVDWWHESGADARFSLLFRPHPRDGDWRARYAAALGRPGVGGAGAEPHRHRRARDAAAARRRRRLERGHRAPRCARQRSAGGLRPLRRGRPAGRVVGGEERHRRALPRRGGLRRVPRGALVRRGRVRARAVPGAAPTSSPRRGARSRRRSSGRWTARARSASSRRS